MVKIYINRNYSIKKETGGFNFNLLFHYKEKRESEKGELGLNGERFNRW